MPDFYVKSDDSTFIPISSDMKVPVEMYIACFDRYLKVIVPLEQLKTALDTMETRYDAWNVGNTNSVCCEEFILQGLDIMHVDYELPSPHGDYKTLFLGKLEYCTLALAEGVICAIERTYIKKHVDKLGYSGVMEFFEKYTYAMADTLLQCAKEAGTWAFTYTEHEISAFQFPDRMPSSAVTALMDFVSSELQSKDFTEASKYIDALLKLYMRR